MNKTGFNSVVLGIVAAVSALFTVIVVAGAIVVMLSSPAQPSGFPDLYNDGRLGLTVEYVKCDGKVLELRTYNNDTKYVFAEVWTLSGKQILLYDIMARKVYIDDNLDGIVDVMVKDVHPSSFLASCTLAEPV